MAARLSWPIRIVILIVLAFFYFPIVVLIALSFNESSVASIWTSFSFRWYVEVTRDSQVLDAFWLSCGIAVLSASMGVVLGTAAGYVFARFRRFRGSTLLAGMVAAPLVMPEVVTALSLLLLFVSLQRMAGGDSSRGIVAMVLSHTTFTMAYSTVLMRARLLTVDPSLEQAALNLGARPWKAFLVITVPIIYPSLVSAWLLSFTLSLDNLVTSSFIAGPTMATLPMVIFSRIRLGNTPELNALATIIVAIAGASVVLANVAIRHEEKRRERAAQLAVKVD
jgi:putrescine transport system permease protein